MKKRKKKPIVIKPKKGQNLSPGEEEFALLLRSEKIPFVREFYYFPGRKFHFDFAWPEIKVAIEMEGVSYYGESRHQSIAGFIRDIEKYNAATFLGWRVFRFTRKMLGRGQMVQVLELIRKEMDQYYNRPTGMAGFGAPTEKEDEHGSKAE